MRSGSSKPSEQPWPISGRRDGGHTLRPYEPTRYSGLVLSDEARGGPVHRWGEDYIASVSLRLSSATAAWIAAAIVAIRASFAAGLRSRAAPSPPQTSLSAASIASTARSVAVFIGRRSGSLASEKGCAFHPIDNPSPTEGEHRANRDRDDTSPRPGRRNRNHLRLERNHPTANCPIGRASGSGGSHVHSRHAPARSVVPRQARSRLAWAREGPPAPMPPMLGPSRSQ